MSLFEGDSGHLPDPAPTATQAPNYDQPSHNAHNSSGATQLWQQHQNDLVDGMTNTPTSDGHHSPMATRSSPTSSWPVVLTPIGMSPSTMIAAKIPGSAHPTPTLTRSASTPAVPVHGALADISTAPATPSSWASSIGVSQVNAVSGMVGPGFGAANRSSDQNDTMVRSFFTRSGILTSNRSSSRISSSSSITWLAGNPRYPAETMQYTIEEQDSHMPSEESVSEILAEYRQTLDASSTSPSNAEQGYDRWRADQGDDTQDCGETISSMSHCTSRTDSNLISEGGAAGILAVTGPHPVEDASHQFGLTSPPLRPTLTAMAAADPFVEGDGLASSSSVSSSSNFFSASSCADGTNSSSFSSYNLQARIRYVRSNRRQQEQYLHQGALAGASVDDNTLNSAIPSSLERAASTNMASSYTSSCVDLNTSMTSSSYLADVVMGMNEGERLDPAPSSSCSAASTVTSWTAGIWRVRQAEVTTTTIADDGDTHALQLGKPRQRPDSELPTAQDLIPPATPQHGLCRTPIYFFDDMSTERTGIMTPGGRYSHKLACAPEASSLSTSSSSSASAEKKTESQDPIRLTLWPWTGASTSKQQELTAEQSRTGVSTSFSFSSCFDWGMRDDESSTVDQGGRACRLGLLILSLLMATLIVSALLVKETENSSPTSSPTPAPSLSPPASSIGQVKIGTSVPTAMVSTRPTSISSLVPTSQPTTTPTIRTVAPSPAPTTLAYQARMWILSASSSSSADLIENDPTSAQANAFSWVMHSLDASPDLQSAAAVAAASSRDEFKQVVLQHYAVAVLYFRTNGSTSWLRSDLWLEWNDSINVCDWYWNLEYAGTFNGSSALPCNDLGMLQYVELPGNDLEGDLPEELALLAPTARVINLNSNNLVGPAMSVLSDTAPIWPELLILDLSINRGLNATIPDDLYVKFPVLDQLYLEKTSLSGSLEAFCQDDNASNTNEEAAQSSPSSLWADCDDVTCSCCTKCCYNLFIGNFCM